MDTLYPPPSTVSNGFTGDGVIITVSFISRTSSFTTVRLIHCVVLSSVNVSSPFELSTKSFRSVLNI